MHQMEQSEQNTFTPKFKDFILDMVKDIHQTDIEYIHRGRITPELISNILDLYKYNLKHTIKISPLRPRIYFIMAEGLQNITKHQDNPEENQELLDNSLIIISKIGGRFKLTTANLIYNKNIDSLKKKLDRINEMTADELRILVREIRRNNMLDNDSNANLGLIEIAKRSGSQLLYRFRQISDQYSYFYLSIEIEVSKLNRAQELLKQDSTYLDRIVEVHDYLNQINSKLIFKGDFSQENILSLLEMLRHQIPESTTSIKVNNIMIEMLQNIEKHGDNIHDIKNWKPGFFMINYLDNAFYLTSANYIMNHRIPLLEKKLMDLNRMNKQELKTLYKRVLLELNSVTAQKTGLGFIDIRRRSGNPFRFTFLPIDDKISLFILQIIVNNS